MTKLTRLNPETGYFELVSTNPDVLNYVIQMFGCYESYLDSLTFGKTIAFARRLNYLTQVELARQIKVTQKTISAIETGKRKPSIKTVEIMADCLQFPRTKLLAAYRKSFFADIPKESLGGIIRAERDFMHISLETMAKETGILKRRLRRFETDKDTPTWGELFKIAGACKSELLNEKAKIMWNEETQQL